jgi:phospholipase C
MQPAPHTRWLTQTALGLALAALFVAGNVATVNSAEKSKDLDAAEAFKTESPIKHVIILIGENRGLDHTFGVYKPKGKGQTISNILSKGIVNANGMPGPNFAQAVQFSVAGQPLYYVGAPHNAKTPYNTSSNVMPQPNTNGAPSAQSNTGAPFETIAEADMEPDLESSNSILLTTGATNLPTDAVDTRVPGAGTLPNGPFVLQGANITDDDYTGDMTHRFYQAWQQSDCSIANATAANPTGCLNDLFPFVMATYAPPNPATKSGNFSEGN